MSNGYAPVLLHQNNGTPRENNLLQLVLLALCIGGIGAVYYLSQPEDGLRGYQKFVSTDAQPAPQPALMALPAAPAQARPNHQFLTSVEVAEAQTATVFHIDQLDGFNLVIDYGDGTSEAVKGQLAEHTYQSAGRYKVELKAAFNGTVEVFQTKILNVATPIEIDMAAPIVERE